LFAPESLSPQHRRFRSGRDLPRDAVRIDGCPTPGVLESVHVDTVVRGIIRLAAEGPGSPARPTAGPEHAVTRVSRPTSGIPAGGASGFLACS